ncbi:hypothetical protein [Streptomyces phaeochromogenes]
MNPEQFPLVRSAISAHKAIRSEISDSLPFWLLGLPARPEAWMASSLRGQAATRRLTLWRREPTVGERAGNPRTVDQHGFDDTTRTLTIPHLRGTGVRPPRHLRRHGDLGRR